MSNTMRNYSRQDGSFLIPLGLGLLVLLGITFYAMDMSLLFNARNQLQTATDASVTRALQLINSAPNPTDEELAEMEHLAELSGIDNLAMYMDSLNIKGWTPESEDSPITVTIDPESHHVVATGQLTIDTWLYDAISGNDWSTSIETQAEGNRKRLIVAVLIDRSESMDHSVETCTECPPNTCADDSKSGKCSGLITYYNDSSESALAGFSWEAYEDGKHAIAAAVRDPNPLDNVVHVFDGAMLFRGDYPEEADTTSGSGKNSGKISGFLSGRKGHKDFPSKMVDEGHVTVCHVPSKDQSKRRTLRVGAAALAAHLAHGDTPGNCAGKNCAAINKCDGLSKLEVAKLAASKFVANYKHKIDLLLTYSFGEETDPLQITSLLGLQAHGGTNIYEAIDTAKEDMISALSNFGDDAYMQLLIVTDGIPGDGVTCSPQDCSLVENSTATKYDRAPYMVALIDFADELRLDPGVRVFSIGIGKEAPITDVWQDRYDNDLLKSVFLRRLANDPATADDVANQLVFPTVMDYSAIKEVNPGLFIHVDGENLDTVAVKFGEEIMTRITK